ncbi:MAG: DUF4349 domain-containing protein [Oscillospiraceae bacterium]
MKKTITALASLTALTMILLSTGCSSASSDYASSYAPASSEAYYAESSAAEAESYYDDTADYSAEEVAPAAPDEGSGVAEMALLAPENAAGIELSYTVDLHIQSTEFMAGIRTLNTTVGDMQGYTVRASVQGRDLLRIDYPRTASYSFQIPSANLSLFLVAMEDNYNLLQMEQSAEDITTRHQQTDNRLEQLQEQEQRLIEAVAATEDPEEKSNLEYQLMDVQSQISALQSSSDQMSRQVHYSTVNVTLSEVIVPVETPEPTWSERLGEVKTATGLRFLSMAQGSLLFLISALPTLAVLLILAVIAFIIYRIWKKHSKGKGPKMTPAPEKDNTDSLE